MIKFIGFLMLLFALTIFVSCDSSSLSKANSKDNDVKKQHHDENESSSKSREFQESRAQDSNSKKDLCGNAKDRVSEAICLREEIERADERMNILIKEFVAGLRRDFGKTAERHISNLGDTQRVWLTYKEKNCKADEELYEGGTDAVVQANFCELDLIDQRFNELIRIYGKK